MSIKQKFIYSSITEKVSPDCSARLIMYLEKVSPKNPLCFYVKGEFFPQNQVIFLSKEAQVYTSLKLKIK